MSRFGSGCTVGDVGEGCQVCFERLRAGGCEFDPREAARVGAGGRAFFAERNEAGFREDLEVLGQFGIIDLQRVTNDGEIELPAATRTGRDGDGDAVSAGVGSGEHRYRGDADCDHDDRPHAGKGRPAENRATSRPRRSRRRR